MTSSGRHSLKLASADSPSAAVRTSYPWLDRTVLKTRVICGSSSTTRTRDFSPTGVDIIIGTPLTYNTHATPTADATGLTSTPFADDGVAVGTVKRTIVPAVAA